MARSRRSAGAASGKEVAGLLRFLLRDDAVAVGVGPEEEPADQEVPASTASFCEIWPSLFASAILNAILPVSCKSCTLSIGPGMSSSSARTPRGRQQDPPPRRPSPDQKASFASVPPRISPAWSDGRFRGMADTIGPATVPVAATCASEVPRSGQTGHRLEVIFPRVKLSRFHQFYPIATSHSYYEHILISVERAPWRRRSRIRFPGRRSQFARSGPSGTSDRVRRPRRRCGSARWRGPAVVGPDDRDDVEAAAMLEELCSLRNSRAARVSRRCFSGVTASAGTPWRRALTSTKTRVAVARDQVDLALRGPIAAQDDPEALPAQVAGGRRSPRSPSSGSGRHARSDSWRRASTRARTKPASVHASRLLDAQALLDLTPFVAHRPRESGRLEEPLGPRT